MAFGSAGARLFDGSVQPTPTGFVQFSTYQYYVDENGNFLLSTNPQTSSSSAVSRDVKLAGGDQIGKCK